MFLQKNPITVVGKLPKTWLFAYRTPVAVARGLLPPQLEPVVFGGWAYWNVVVSRIEAMRLRGFPALSGGVLARGVPTLCALSAEGWCRHRGAVLCAERLRQRADDAGREGHDRF